MSLRKRSKECLIAVRGIFEVNLSLIKCMVKIMNRDGMAEEKAPAYFQDSLYWKCFLKISLQFFTGEKLSEMSGQQSIQFLFKVEKVVPEWFKGCVYICVTYTEHGENQNWMNSAKLPFVDNLQQIVLCCDLAVDLQQAHGSRACLLLHFA